MGNGLKYVYFSWVLLEGYVAYSSIRVIPAKKKYAYTTCSFEQWERLSSRDK